MSDFFNIQYIFSNSEAGTLRRTGGARGSYSEPGLGGGRIVSISGRLADWGMPSVYTWYNRRFVSASILLFSLIWH